ncbi:hypothetical protein ACEZDB_10130 [Streptacidiphilus sp. N1-3]|uniref:Uncharacterized protein n=1 Tax=Streptacidiphilus alkalitolerans TaxID=3342712 RepID=A0ABV6WZ54_9ACTN
MGDPIILGVEGLRWQAGDADARNILELSGVECFEGFQRLVTIAHSFREMPREQLSRSIIRVEIVTGEDRDRIRALCDSAHRLVNSTRPQDNLAKCRYLNLAAAEFKAEGGHFDCRRGIVAGPHPVGFSVADVFRSLAALVPDPLPYLAHELQDETGLDELWSDIGSARYGSLVHADLHAFGIQRAVEARRATQQTISRVRRTRDAGHYKLLEYAPELVTWLSCRVLPLDRLHDGGRDAPRWMQIIHTELIPETERVAVALVEAYQQVRPERHVFLKQAPKLDLWLELIDRVR